MNTHRGHLYRREGERERERRERGGRGEERERERRERESKATVIILACTYIVYTLYMILYMLHTFDTVLMQLV